jgi:hypothetical protein
MTEAQLNATAALGDLILPADDLSPAASAIGVHEFIDEWVSAPYPDQRIDRVLILEGLEWLERQCRERFDTSFANAAPASQSELIEIIAHPENVDVELARQALFFGRFRYLAVGAYYTTQPGIDDIGYIGNQPIAGDYPGPGEEAMNHLSMVLQQLGLPTASPGN